MNTQTSNAAGQYGLTILRLVVGTVFLAHGAQKAFVYGLSGVIGAFEGMGIPAPALTASFTTGVELVGGLALILGLATRYAAPALAVVMLGALLTAHVQAGFFLPDGYEFVLTLLAASVALALTGPGALALDNVVGQRTAGYVSGTIAEQKARRAAA